MEFLEGARVLYAVPTQEQVDRFWTVTKGILAPAIDAGIFVKNETRHLIERPGTNQRIRAKTAWNADTLRGDFADLLLLDEYQLMDETAWAEVGAPMMLDTDGDVIFSFTPPSLATRSVSKAKNKRHAIELWRRASQDTTGRWAAFHFTSHDNPYLSRTALDDITEDMTNLAVRQEILAEDIDERPGALWTLADIDANRREAAPELVRIVVGVDPPGGLVTECGIVVAGLDDNDHTYTLADYSQAGRPAQWGIAAVRAFVEWNADCIVAERNHGGEMVLQTLEIAAQELSVYIDVVMTTASHGKAARAQPSAARAEKGKDHHVGAFPQLEEELVNWVPGEGLPSPNRLDAKVWADYELIVAPKQKVIRAW